VLSFHASSYASKPDQDLFFKGSSDLVFQTEELSVGKKTVCSLTVHYDGKYPVLALVKIYLDGTNITSFPAEFKAAGEQAGNFSFRTERQGKHHLEFVIMTPGEVQEKQFENNRISVAFMVPGGVVKKEPPLAEEIKLEPKPEPVVKKKLERQVVIQKEKVIPKNVDEISRIEEGYEDQDLSRADEVAYLEQPSAYYEEESVVPKEYETMAFSKGKPIIDVFFPDSDAFKLHKSKSKNRLTLSWELLIQSSGEGEGEIQIVIADGNKQIITQHAWLRAGEALHLPMQATFDRAGPHRLTAMINTQNNFVDRNMDNNIVEQTIQIQ